MTEPAPGRVDVWLCTPEEFDQQATLARCERLLDSDERARGERFRFDRHRNRFLVSHALVRTSLSRYGTAPPEVWQFREVGRGRPEIAAPVEAVGLRFNLSHTDRLAACGVAGRDDVGVDVEAAIRVTRHLAVAERFFSKREAAELRGLPAEQQVDRFLDYWTLKEAYIKARGEGLALPLDGFTFVLDADSPRIEFERDLGDAADSWQFHLASPTPEHRLAVALRAETLVVTSRFVDPLGE
ncbi:MAG: 4'-phosphopantetheinyl transferase superfamily protein [Myxococcales bacterium]|nr:4'-phosphopantetheinyl transferase superfamily protein [Myxococcales bacterium]